MPVPSDPKTHPYMFSDDMKWIQKAIIFHPDKEGTFLILMRADFHVNRPGTWDFAGGNILYGEDPIESITREITEETGLTTKDIRGLLPFDVYSNADLSPDYILYGCSYIAFANRADITVSHEHTDFRWVTLEEFKSLQPADFLLHAAEKAFQDLRPLLFSTTSRT